MVGRFFHFGMLLLHLCLVFFQFLICLHLCMFFELLDCFLHFFCDIVFPSSPWSAGRRNRSTSTTKTRKQKTLKTQQKTKSRYNICKELMKIYEIDVTIYKQIYTKCKHILSIYTISVKHD